MARSGRAPKPQGNQAPQQGMLHMSNNSKHASADLVERVLSWLALFSKPAPDRASGWHARGSAGLPCQCPSEYDCKSWCRGYPALRLELCSCNRPPALLACAGRLPPSFAFLLVLVILCVRPLPLGHPVFLCNYCCDPSFWCRASGRSERSVIIFGSTALRGAEWSQAAW